MINRLLYTDFLNVALPRLSLPTFPHRTFQEYLAGVHLAQRPNFVSTAVELAESGAFWREVILLAVGYKVHSQGEHDLILGLVGALCPTRKPATETDWRKVRLAGDALLEMGLSRVERQERGEELLGRVRVRLTDLVEQGCLDPAERAQAGEVLGSVGDPRFTVERFFLPCRYRGEAEPNLGFVEIPAGPFWMGEESEEQTLTIPYRYWIARYPVTVAQFACFVKDSGYSDERWWRTQAARKWLGGEKRYGTALDNWDTQCLHPNRPVWANWFEAMAYCAWLDAWLRVLDNSSVPAGYEVRLSSEAEWEKAARSGSRMPYPWGDQDWDEQRANIDRSDINHPTPVGMYPLGATPSGVQDLAGNVWEWTLSAWGDYPYDPSHNEREGDAFRVLRGGSWINGARAARCAFRSRLGPDLLNTRWGWRVVVSLADSGF